VELPARRADQLRQAALVGRVNVFVPVLDLELAGRPLLLQCWRFLCRVDRVVMVSKSITEAPPIGMRHKMDSDDVHTCMEPVFLHTVSECAP
jgi:hypothetical protein